MASECVGLCCYQSAWTGCDAYWLAVVAGIDLVEDVAHIVSFGFQSRLLQVSERRVGAQAQVIGGRKLLWVCAKYFFQVNLLGLWSLCMNNPFTVDLRGE